MPRAQSNPEGAGSKPGSQGAATTGGGAGNTPPAQGAGAEEAVRPFQEAALKYVQAAMTARDSIVKESLQAELSRHVAARRIEQEAYEGLVEATKQHMEKMTSPPGGDAQETYAARAQSHLEYEQGIREIYSNAYAKLAELGQNAQGPNSEDLAGKFSSLRQSAYEAYVADLQNAWSGLAAADPQTVKAIASHI